MDRLLAEIYKKKTSYGKERMAFQRFPAKGVVLSFPKHLSQKCYLERVSHASKQPRLLGVADDAVVVKALRFWF